MPTLVSCPNCSGQLRITDELFGRQVRCPTCSHIFTAPLASGDETAPAVPLEMAAPPPAGGGRPELSLDEVEEAILKIVRSRVTNGKELS